MSDLVPVSPERPLPSAELVTLRSDVPSLEELFRFARDAELRVRSLRMTIEERVRNARDEELTWHEVLIRHPGQARVTSRHSEDPLSRDYQVWIGDSETVRTFDAGHRLASVRARRPGVVGSERPDLPPWSRTRAVLTELPHGSIADAFVHPHGLFRNVLVTGPLAIVGTTLVAGREAFLVRADHPRATKVLTDRPDRRVEVAIDRASGFLLRLVEHIGEHVTREARVTLLELDAEIRDSAFSLHLGADVRMIY